ncbi:MAG: bifunctional sterol desaturase/short chain dehydrogenase [Synechococcaceae cyanobacterium SM2_3_1]|nr:bifunctional sterol desaturase/short chain dehydrogenase [Synechococcaceae cyanobacterium SM2_3_1]
MQEGYHGLNPITCSMGPPIQLAGKTIALTGSSGTLGQALLKKLHEQGSHLIALTTGSYPFAETLESAHLEVIPWRVGEEQALAEVLKRVDILILNHGINVHAERTPEAIQKSYEVNTFSCWRLLELFLTTIPAESQPTQKEIWINTSEAEVSPAVSPLYELSKRAIGDLITLRRLDAPCGIRKLILGPFKSHLNPIGIMSADWVAAQIVAQAKGGRRNIIVAINPLTYVLFPWKEFWMSTYFRLFSRAPVESAAPEVTPQESQG